MTQTDKDRVPSPTPATVAQAYKVECDHGGCEHCRQGRTWTIVGPDGVAEGQSFFTREDAEDLADYMNCAYAAGRADLLAAPRGEAAEWQQLVDDHSKALEFVREIAASEDWHDACECLVCRARAWLHTPSALSGLPVAPAGREQNENLK